ncbi:hypothetical protein AVEN_75243-1 [Araneus ventricosus]|uniref:Uncharacterized protein n=1 Tax=Araneus ventricosus TaxID=182803 RepID=A0A4Y2WKT7_ARAVE|nr:hypothetical protein AVEN_75243-1 [Araneus ventricosus]
MECSKENRTGELGKPLYSIIYDFENLSYANAVSVKTPLKPGVLGRKRHELDFPNLDGYLPHPQTPSYNLPLRRTEMAVVGKGIGPLPCLSPKQSRTSPPLRRSQPPQTGLRRC